MRCPIDLPVSLRGNGPDKIPLFRELESCPLLDPRRDVSILFNIVKSLVILCQSFQRVRVAGCCASPVQEECRGYQAERIFSPSEWSGSQIQRQRRYSVGETGDDEDFLGGKCRSIVTR